MSYVSLFRQYRPQRFDEVHGQEHVTRTLQNAIRLGRTAQAYLFCGPRGVGKTTVARILAKALNCQQGPTPEPCGECESCQRINSGASLTVIEIDAASHRGIDDIRALREDVQFAPTDGRVKVYILDEAHQVTGPAFEAFLKTLEEPPPHAVFVLATTEAQKIPATILSRCQRFDFRRVSIDDMVARLGDVVRAESLDVEEAALHAISRSADGSLRDALSILDQIIAYSGERVRAADVEAVLGLLDAETRFALADHVADRDVAATLRWVAALLDSGRDARLVVGEALSHFRLVLLARLGCVPEALATLPDDVRARIEAQAERFEVDELTYAIETLAAGDKALRWHPQPRILLEVTLLDVVRGPREPLAPRSAPVQRMAPAPRPLEPAAAVSSGAVAPPPRPPREAKRDEPPSRPSPPPEAAPPPARRSEPPAAAPEPAPPATDPALTLDAVQARWPQVVARLRQVAPPLAAHLVHATVVRLENDSVVCGFRGWEASLSVCRQEDRRRVIEDTLAKVLGRPVRFDGELVPEASAAAVEETLDLDAAVGVALEVFPGAELIDE